MPDRRLRGRRRRPRTGPGGGWNPDATSKGHDGAARTQCGEHAFGWPPNPARSESPVPGVRAGGGRRGRRESERGCRQGTRRQTTRPFRTGRSRWQTEQCSGGIMRRLHAGGYPARASPHRTSRVPVDRRRPRASRPAERRTTPHEGGSTRAVSPEGRGSDEIVSTVTGQIPVFSVPQIVPAKHPSVDNDSALMQINPQPDEITSLSPGVFEHAHRSRTRTGRLIVPNTGGEGKLTADGI